MADPAGGPPGPVVPVLAGAGGLAGLHVVGADLVEVCPPLDPTATTAIAAVTLALDLAHLLALGRTPKPGR